MKRVLQFISGLVVAATLFAGPIPIGFWQNSSSAFAPTDIAGLKIWNQGDTATGSAGAVTAPDGTVNNNNLVSTGGDGPTIISAALNGHKVLRFDGTNDYLSCAGFSIAQPDTVFIVASENNAANLQFFFDGATNRQALFAGSDDSLKAFGGSTVQTSAVGTIGTAAHVYCIIFSGGNLTVYRDGVVWVPTSTGGISDLTSLLIGVANGAANFLHGDVAEFLVYNTALSNFNRHRVQDYLGTKYGITITPEYVTIAVNDSNIVSGLSPTNWQLSGSTFIKSINPGGYDDFGVLNTTTIGLQVDNNTISLAANEYPRIRWSVDGGAFTEYQLASTDTVIPLATGLGLSGHTLNLHYRSSESLNEAQWGGQNALKITGLRLDIDGTTTAATPGSTIALWYGDSITKGAWSLAAPAALGSESDSSNADLSYAKIISSANGWSYGIIAFSGQQWDAPYNGDIPALPNSYNFILNSVSRTFGTPNLVFVNEGENGTIASSATVTTFMTNLRSACGSNTYINMIVPFSQNNATNLIAGYNAYVAAHPSDTRVNLINTGSAGQTNASVNSTDGIHLNTTGHINAAALITPLILGP